MGLRRSFSEVSKYFERSGVLGASGRPVKARAIVSMLTIDREVHGIAHVSSLAASARRPYARSMKPGDHPEFFRFPAPEGRSRESTIRIDADGRFWHEGALVEHPGLAAALHSWISRHPDDGRYILTNGYDWTYFKVDDAPYFVRAVKVDGERVLLALSDGTEEGWDPKQSRVGADGAIYTRVKAAAKGGPYEAKFTRHAQTALAPLLVDQGGAPAVRMGERVVPIGS
jgi:hypothetical protein